MHYRTIAPEDYDAARRLLAESGWQTRVQDPDRFQKMVENADRIVVAAEGARIVGFARALCDDVSNGYISMVVVAADRRGRGIGTQLVKRLMGDDPHITWVLRAGRNSMGFWQKMGFRISDIAMERVRTSE